jgi:NAD(P)-dependent dehydrogenase (short-subunit alcohol dehydrogenase family)
MGGLDILVNNAGIGAQGAVTDSTDEEWHRVLDVNVVGLARVSRTAWPHLCASSSAAVVNTASIAATAGLPQRAVYSASKGAVLALTRAMAADGMADGVRVNAVCPGTMDTELMRDCAEASPDPATYYRTFEAYHPLGRLASPEEIADFVLCVGSPAAGFMTGAALAIDGGSTAGRF